MLNEKISADTPTYKWKKYRLSMKNRKEQNRIVSDKVC